MITLNGVLSCLSHTGHIDVVMKIQQLLNGAITRTLRINFSNYVSPYIDYIIYFIYLNQTARSIYREHTQRQTDRIQKSDKSGRKRQFHFRAHPPVRHAPAKQNSWRHENGRRKTIGLLQEAC